MKKIILIISIFSLLLCNNANADDTYTDGWNTVETQNERDKIPETYTDGWDSWATDKERQESNSSSIKVGVPIDFSSVLNWCAWAEWDYYCMVPKWSSWFQVVMAWIIKFIIFIASLAWVLFIVINWILYSMAWLNDSLKTESKDRIVKTLVWIVLLLMSWTILNIVAPWVYK